ncbi:MAG: SurA N-terminal domain-containing protein [Nanoarchaeota archaeon]
MRNPKKKQIKQIKNNPNLWKYLVGLVLVILVVLGVIIFLSRDNSNLNKDVIATVNEEEITASEVSAIQESFLQQGEQISEEDALEQIINKKLILQEINKGNYAVSSEEAESAIEQQLSMQGASLDDYKQQLSQQGISYEEQLESIKEELKIQKYLENQFKDENFEVSEEEAQDFYELSKSQSTEEIPSYEELESQIISILEQQKQQKAIETLVQELKANAEIEYLKEVDSEAESTEDFPIEITE